MFAFIRKNKAFFFTSLIVAVAIIVYFLFRYFCLYTNHAFVEANVVSLSPQVAGKISAVYIKNNQYVRKGQILLKISNRQYQQRLSLAVAKLQSTEQNYNSLRLQYLQAIYALRHLQIVIQNKQNPRLSSQKTLSTRHAKNISKALLSQDHDTLITLNSLRARINNLKSILGRNLGDYAPYKIAQSEWRIAILALRNMTMVSPVNGYVTAFHWQKGDVVTVKQSPFAIIEDDSWYVLSYIKETNLRTIAPGDPVWLRVSGSTTRWLRGRIIGISWGVNRLEASHNVVNSPLPYVPRQVDWIQLAQRFPVEISFETLPHGLHLRVGETARVFMFKSR